MHEFESLLEAYQLAGGELTVIQSPQAARLMVNGNQIVENREVPGVQLIGEELPDGVRARVVVEPNVKLKQPVHLCFGVVAAEGVQRIISHFEIGAGAEVAFVAHCTFPHAIQVQHLMDAVVEIGPGASLDYTETHYHGPDGGVQVIPNTKVSVGENAEYRGEFVLIDGRVGLLELDTEIDVAANGRAELITKANGTADDRVMVKETIRLNGENARGLVKARIALRDHAFSEVVGTTEGNAPGARGHVDCVEIVRDHAIANAIPIVKVTDPRAHVTHEAAIGTVDKKELETLMARGLDEDTAVDVIVRGMLR